MVELFSICMNMFPDGGDSSVQSCFAQADRIYDMVTLNLDMPANRYSLYSLKTLEIRFRLVQVFRRSLAISTIQVQKSTTFLKCDKICHYEGPNIPKSISLILCNFPIKILNLISSALNCLVNSSSLAFNLCSIACCPSPNCNKILL